MSSKKIRIFSYNIHKGFSGVTRKYTLHKVRDELRKLQPDIIFLQEVHGDHVGHKKRLATWPKNSQFEYLAEGVWPHFSYGKNAIYSKGHHGNAILSKYPILAWENLDISANPFEKRGLLHATIQVSRELPPVHAICVHLGLLEEDRKKQLSALALRIRNRVPFDQPLVIAGDFNDWRKNANAPLVERLGLQEAFLEYQGKNAKTFPSFMPVLPLDRVYCRGFKVEWSKCLTKSPWERLSDHGALEVELVFNGF